MKTLCQAVLSTALALLSLSSSAHAAANTVEVTFTGEPAHVLFDRMSEATQETEPGLLREVGSNFECVRLTHEIVNGIPNNEYWCEEEIAMNAKGEASLTPVRK